jgi:hypothetical protein
MYLTAYFRTIHKNTSPPAPLHKIGEKIVLRILQNVKSLFYIGRSPIGVKGI